LIGVDRNENFFSLFSGLKVAECSIYNLLCVSVHNWTVDQVVQWLTHDVELPQYSDAFRINVVDGCTLPRWVLLSQI